MDWENVQRDVQTTFPDVRRLAPDTLIQWFEEDGGRPVRIVDVRAKEEFDISHLTGARHWDGAAESESAPGGVGLDDRVVVYCAVGYRSSAAVRTLQDMGYTDVYRLDGDLFGWVNAGRAVVKDGEPVDKAHPFNRRWGELLRPDSRADS